MAASAASAWAQPAPDLVPGDPTAADPVPAAPVAGTDPAPATEPSPPAQLAPLAAPAPGQPAIVGPPEPTLTDVHDLSTLGIFLGGAAVAFFAHESGHVVTNLAYGNVPRLVPITTFGFIPFVAIAGDIRCDDAMCYTRDNKEFGGGRAGKYVIVTAGFTVQHLTTELLLSLEPHLRYRRAPFRKGVLAFDILVSVGYALSTWTRTEDTFGDSGTAADTSGIPRDVFAALLITPALIDTYRFLRPDSHSRWLPYASRASKATMFGITFAL